jgi:outer membrane biosynthesis protein TonB
MKAKAAMSTAPPTPPQPIPPKAPLMLRVRDDLLVAVIIILAITSAICTGVIATVMVIDRVARPAAVVSETPKKPDVPVPAKPVTPEKPVTPINPEPPIVTPTPSPEKPAAPATPLGSAVRDYREGLATEFADLAVQVRSGALKTGADVAAAARTYAAPMATAMGKAVGTYCDAQGNITDSAGLAKEFDQAAQSLRGK